MSRALVQFELGTRPWNSAKETAALPAWNHHILATRHVPPVGDEDRSLALVDGATKALHPKDTIAEQVIKIELVADDIGRLTVIATATAIQAIRNPATAIRRASSTPVGMTSSSGTQPHNLRGHGEAPEQLAIQTS